MNSQAMNDGNDTIQVEVAYALAHKQKIIPLTVNKGCTAAEAVAQSGIERDFPDLQLEGAKLGIFGQAVMKPATRVLEEGERVEIYRPLIADPKEVRKQRAARVKAEKAAAKKS